MKIVNLSIKEKLKKVNFKNYFIYQIEPKFEQLNYGFSVLRNDYIEFIDTTEENCPIILKLNCSDIDRIYIEEILMDIYMKDGQVYHFKELRLDLNKILNDFKGDEITICNKNGVNIIQNYKVILEDNMLSIVGNKVNETENITPIKFNINYNDIVGINEEYTYDKCRQVNIKTKNDNILIYS